MQLLTQILPLLSQFGFDLDLVTQDEFLHALPSFYNYIKESNSPNFVTTKFYLPMLAPFIKLRPIPTEICYESYGCFTNENDFSCLSGALPANPADSTFHLRRYLGKNTFDLVPFEPISSFWTGTSKLTLLIHGWRSTSNGLWQFNSLNNDLVVALDWRKEASSLHYLECAQNGRTIARRVVDFLASAVENGVPLNQIHVIGMSLGAHVAGFIAKETRYKIGKIGRLTGLDPAGPFFENCNPGARMDLSDADLVDVIHTNPGQLPNKGIDIPIGHFDYYIAPPKWCTDSLCAHLLAPKIYQMSTYKPYWSKDCTDLIKYTGPIVTDIYRPKISHLVELDYTDFEACFFKNMKSFFVHQLGQ